MLEDPVNDVCWVFNWKFRNGIFLSCNTNNRKNSNTGTRVHPTQSSPEKKLSQNILHPKKAASGILLKWSDHLIVLFKTVSLSVHLWVGDMTLVKKKIPRQFWVFWLLFLSHGWLSLSTGHSASTLQLSCWSSNKQADPSSLGLRASPLCLNKTHSPIFCTNVLLPVASSD